MNSLEDIIRDVDLPALIAQLYPESGAIPSKECRCKAVWRGGKRESVSLYKGTNSTWLYKDFAQDTSGNAFHWLMEAHDLTKKEAAEFLKHCSNGNGSTHKNKDGLGQIINVYDYKDKNGTLIHQTVRFESKEFRQRRPANNNGSWVWGLKADVYYKNTFGDWSKSGKGEAREFLDCQTIPYNLKAILDARAKDETIIVVEGEKDANTLIDLGFVATCNCGGAGNWTKEELAQLGGAKVVIFGDFDELDPKTKKRKGVVAANELANSLVMGIAKSVHGPVFMPNSLKDVSDYVASGAKAEQIQELIDKAKPWHFKLATELNLVDSKKDNSNKEPTKQTTKETPAQAAARLLEDIEFFHDADGIGYASITVAEHIETYQLTQSGFKEFVNKTYYKKTKNVLSSQTLSDVLNLLEARAKHDGEEHPTFHRIARFENNIYLNLCNNNWEVVEITADGWKIINTRDSPVKFIKPKGAGALPTPQRGGSVDMLRAFIHLPDEEWLLIASFLMACLKPEGPYPILNLVAEQGSGKSTTAKILKWLVDPTSTRGRLLRLSPRDEQSIFIGAKNNHVLAFDNLSGVRPWLSDALCVLSTGGSFVSRALYTDSEETILEAVRPVILTGIGDLATRGDLLSRSLIVSLPRLAREIVNEEILWKALEASRPQILGGLLDGVALGIRNKDTLEHKPETRLADFECWAVACEDALGVEEAKFTTAYRHSRQTSVEVVLSNSPLPPQITALLKRKGGIWQGTSSELLADLEEFASERTLRQHGWPKTPNQLGKDMDRLAPSLREVGINFERFRQADVTRTRLLRLKLE